jgi:hypothetical protein
LEQSGVDRVVGAGGFVGFGEEVGLAHLFRI